MKQAFALLLTFVFSCLISSVVGYGSGISSTVFQIGSLQTETGGFQSQLMEGIPAAATLAETEHALFLSSLFGTKDQINREAALSFLLSCENADGGFGDAPGQPSDLESSRRAILCGQHLEHNFGPQSSLVKFVSSLYDSNTKLYRNNVGAPSDYRATARALEILTTLESVNESVNSEIAENLKESIKEENDMTFFSSITADNYFGIYVAQMVNLELEDPDLWMAYFRSRQVVGGAQRGGFYSDNYEQSVSEEDAAHALNALFLLGRGVVSQANVNLQALYGYLTSLPRGLAAAAHAYAALARTAVLRETTFKLTPNYHVKDKNFKIVENRIVEGTLFRPTASLRTSYGLVHTSASISLTVDSDTKEFVFNKDTGRYEIPEYFFDSTDKFGELKLTYTASWFVPGFGKISFSVVDTKSIGYDIEIDSDAVYNDQDIAVGGVVGFGTTFNFLVKLGTVSIPKPELVSGDFEITFSALDSAGVYFVDETIDFNDNTGPIRFKHDIKSAALPAGQITFRFQVSNMNGLHTSQDVSFILDVPMVATDVNFPENKGVVKFGDRVTVSMTPASFTDGDIHKYPPGQRKFFLDLFTEGGLKVVSFPGEMEDSEEFARVTFGFSINARFDMIGKLTLKFRYTDDMENDVVVGNYDDEIGDLKREDLFLTVETELSIDELEGAPHEGELHFGNEVAFSFKVTDSLSQSDITAAGGSATVWLALRHTDGGSTFSSVLVKGTPDVDPTTGRPSGTWSIKWVVGADALKEKGTLELYAQDIDGRQFPLIHNGAPWIVPVTIGGSIVIEEKTFSQEFDDEDTLFSVSFDLSSEDKKLPVAKFQSTITYDTSIIANLPVTSDGEGNYQVAWSIPTSQAKGGAYVVNVFRSVDIERKSGAFFTISHQHEVEEQSPLPFKTEFVVLLILVVVVVVTSMQKLRIEKPLK